jgi:Spy/CpxP family protein refolding chaperone
MKMVRNKILALAGAAVLAPALLFAAAAATHANHGDFSQHLAQKLGLSAEQTQQVQGVFANHKAELSAQMDRMKTAKSTLFDAVHADTFDEGTIRAAAANVAQVEADLAVSHAKMASEVRGFLTPDQQAKAKELMANFRDRAQKRGDRLQHHINGALDGGN